MNDDIEKTQLLRAARELLMASCRKVSDPSQFIRLAGHIDALLVTARPVKDSCETCSLAHDDNIKLTRELEQLKAHNRGLERLLHSAKKQRDIALDLLVERERGEDERPQ